MRSRPRFGLGLLVMLAALGGCNTDNESPPARAPEPLTSSPPEPVTPALPQQGDLPTASSESANPATPHPPSAAALPSTRETAEATPNDIALASKIEAAIAAETALHGASIAVKAADGVVTLSGSTKDPGLRSMAAQVALSVPGVRSVRNELTISADV